MSLATGRSPDGVRVERVVRINTRLVLITLAVMAVGGIGLHFLHGYQLHRSADALHTRAVAAREAGNTAEAIQVLSQYVALRPRDDDAVVELAQLLAANYPEPKTQARVFLMLEGVLQRGPDRADRATLERLLADAAMRLRRWDDALLHLSALQKRNPQDTELVRQIGECQEGAGRRRDAARQYVLALRDPRSITTWARLVSLLSANPSDAPRREALTKDGVAPELASLFPEDGAPVDAEALAEGLMARMVAQGEPRHTAYLARAMFRQQQGRSDLAGEDVDTALASAPEDPEVLLAAAEQALHRAEAARLRGDPKDAQAQLDRARTHGEAGLTLPKTDLRFYLSLSRVELQRGQAVEGEKHLREGLQKVVAAAKSARPEERQFLANLKMEFQFALADLLVSRLDGGSQKADPRQEIETLTREILATAAVPSLVEFLKARVSMADKEWHTAASALEQARPGLARFPALVRRADLLLGLCYEQIANPDARLAVFRRAMRTDPAWLEGRLRLARALVDCNRPDEAAAEYASPLLIGVRGVPTDLARLLIARELSLPLTRRNLAQAGRVLDIAETTSPGAADVVVVRGELLIAQGKLDEAEALLQNAQKERVQEPTLWAARISLVLARTDREPAARLAEANQLLEQARAAAPDHVSLRLASALRALFLKGAEAKQILVEAGAAVDQLSTDDQVRFLEGVAQIQSRVGTTAEVRATWDRIAKLRPRSVQPRLMQVELAFRENDLPAVDRLIEQLVDIEGPEGPNAKVIKATQIIERARQSPELRKDRAALEVQIGLARTLLNQAARQRPLWAMVPRAQALAELVIDSAEQANLHFRKAYELGDRSPEVVGALVAHYSRQDALDEADRILREIEQEKPTLLTGELSRLASQVAWQRRDYERAATVARAASERSTDFQKTIWTANVLFAQYRLLNAQERLASTGLDKLKEASALYEEAIKTAPDKPAAWFAYIYYLAQVDRLEDAREAIAQAEQKLPETPAYLRPLNMGRFHETIGDREKATEYFRAAVAASPTVAELRIVVADFFLRTGNLREADEHLTRLLDPEFKAAEVAVNWARVRQALSVAARGGYDDTTQALRQLSEARKKEGQTSQDNLRSEIAILSRRFTPADRLALVKALEELERQGFAQSQDRFRLAQACELAKDWPKATAVMQKLLAAEPSQPAYLAWYAAALLRNAKGDPQKISEAKDLVDRLALVEPDSYGTAELEARLIAASGEAEAASQHLWTFVDRREAEVDKAADPKVEKARVSEFARLAGDVCEELDRTATAEDLFRKHAELAEAPEAITVLATFLGRQRAVDRALQVCEEAEAKCIPEATAITAVNVVSAGQPEPDQLARANALTERALAKQPDSPRILAALAGLRGVQHEFLKAELLYRQLLQKDERNLVALNNLAFQLAYEGRNAEALELINRAIGLAGPVPALLDTRAVVYLSLDRTEDALADLREAMAISPRPGMYFHLAQAHLKQGDKTAARDAFLQRADTPLTIGSLHPLEQPAFREFAQLIAPPAS